MLSATECVLLMMRLMLLLCTWAALLVLHRHIRLLIKQRVHKRLYRIKRLSQLARVDQRITEVEDVAPLAVWQYLILDELSDGV